MMKNLQFAMAVLIAFLVIGCATAKAPKTATGGKIAIFVFFDRGDPTTMTEKQFEMRNQVGDLMEINLLNILKRQGYETHLISKREYYTYAPEKYLLSVKIVSYNPGSQAARILVGYGAGATSLNIHYDLLEGDKTVLADDPGFGSSRDWRNCVVKLNKQIAKAVANKLSQLHR